MYRLLAKKYAREVMAVEAGEPQQSSEPDIFFTKVDLQDVVPHEVTGGRRVHRVIVNQ